MEQESRNGVAFRERRKQGTIASWLAPESKKRQQGCWRYGYEAQ
jgi:hypothetical protein